MQPVLKNLVSRIVSGGQTGVDRATLDWAIEHELDHGGWCPAGRLAEDGVLDGRYLLRETESAAYRQRTRQNVLDSDGTLVLNLGNVDGGTLETVRFAERFGKPHTIVQLDRGIVAQDVEHVLDWLCAEHISTLNVAGPREAKRP